MKLSKDSLWTDQATEDFFEYSRKRDFKSLEKIRKIFNAIHRDPETEMLRSERLKGEMAGYFSQRVNKKDRFVYQIDESVEPPVLIVISCKSHYGDK